MSSRIDEDQQVRRDVKGAVWVLVPVLGLAAIVVAALWPEFQERTELKLQEAKGDLGAAVGELTRRQR